MTDTNQDQVQDQTQAQELPQGPTITITGPPDCGKSVIAELIQYLLVRHGFNATLSTPEGLIEAENAPLKMEYDFEFDRRPITIIDQDNSEGIAHVSQES